MITPRSFLYPGVMAHPCSKETLILSGRGRFLRTMRDIYGNIWKIDYNEKEYQECERE